jgi:hypothetical protein
VCGSIGHSSPLLSVAGPAWIPVGTYEQLRSILTHYYANVKVE